MTDLDAIKVMQSCLDDPTSDADEMRLALAFALDALRKSKPVNGDAARAHSRARQEITRLLRAAA